MERYEQQHVPPDQVALDTAYRGMREAQKQKTGFDRIFDAVDLFDRMGQAQRHADTFRYLGEDKQVRTTLEAEIDAARNAGNDERVMTLIRVSHLMGHTRNPIGISAETIGKIASILDVPDRFNPFKRAAALVAGTETGTATITRYNLLFEEHNKQ